jgi:hypothetical protein
MRQHYLPYEIIERIAHFADIDSRRALGFPPRRLSPQLLAFMERRVGWTLASTDSTHYDGYSETLVRLIIRRGKHYLIWQLNNENNETYRRVVLHNTYSCFNKETYTQSLTDHTWHSHVDLHARHEVKECERLYDHCDRYIGGGNVPASIMCDRVNWKEFPKSRCTDPNHQNCNVEFWDISKFPQYQTQ